VLCLAGTVGLTVSGELPGRGLVAAQLFNFNTQLEQAVTVFLVAVLCVVSCVEL
jgi:hypothetical protein